MKRTAPKGITITDVAPKARVSAITVSLAFNAPQTLARVREAVAELGYVPNRLAGGLSSSKSRLIAAIVPTVAHSLFSTSSVQVFSDTMSRAGYQVLLGLSGYSDENEDLLLDAVLSRRPEGVLLTGVANTPTLRGRLRKIGIPIVETWDMTDDPIDMLVGFAHEKIGEAVAHRMIASGVKRPALVSANDQRALSAPARFHRYLRAARRARDRRCPGAPAKFRRRRQGRGRAHSRCARQGDVDAIFCSSDLLALGVVSEARKRGIDVPERIAVCGFGDLDFAADTMLALTTVRVDGKRIGATGVRCLIERLNGSTERVRADVGFELVERETL